MKHEVTVELHGGKSIHFETGKLAKQAHGSCIVRIGDNVVLATACANPDPREGIDFFPLTVDYREYTYAAGRIPGGFIKREGRPSEREILTSRQIDRPIRPLFPEGFRCETQVIAMVLSADTENDPDVAGINGASVALSVSDIPFHGPIGAVRVGQVDGNFIINPTYDEQRSGKLNLMVVGTADGIVMIESGAKEVSEETVVQGIEFGHETPLAEAIDDARALSLFASERVIFAGNAEAALPRTRSDEDAEDSEGAAGSADTLAAYMKDPTPGVVLVFDAPRFDFEGEDKKKQERVRKFYAAVGDPVEFKRASADEARREAAGLARRAGLSIDPATVDLLVEALAADLTRIAVEVEKMSLYAQGRPVTEEDVALLVPDARATTIFALVGALGRRDRSRSLEILDTLFRDGEYLPVALSFLSAQFRAALVAKEAGLRSPQQIQGHFAKMGVQMWGSRAEQVSQTVAKFSKPQLERAMELTFEADRDLRSARPDDRIVMEQFILRLTG